MEVSLMRIRTEVLLGLMSAIASAGCFAPGHEAPGNLETSRGNQIDDNGLKINGLKINGLKINGLKINGLNVNDLANLDFAEWFNHADDNDIALHAHTMKYVVGCALAPDQYTEFTDETGALHTWTGVLGLAPNWFNGAPTHQDRRW